jgi:hypothetical protein
MGTRGLRRKAAPAAIGMLTLALLLGTTGLEGAGASPRAIGVHDLRAIEPFDQTTETDGPWLLHHARGALAGGGGSIPSKIECATHPSEDRDVLLECPKDSMFPTVEPVITVDPADPLHMVAAAIDFGSTYGAQNFLTGMEFYATFDGGETWLNGDLSRSSKSRVALDPGIIFDRKHRTVIFAAQDFDVSTGTYCDGNQIAAVSGDGGRHWGLPVVVDAGSGCIGVEEATWYEHAHFMVTDNNPASPHYGRTYLVTNRLHCSDAECDPTIGHLKGEVIENHSDDGGYTWSPAQVISGSDATYCTFFGPSCDLSDLPTPAVAPDGSIHVGFANFQHEAAWEPREMFESQLMETSSTDGGATWSAPLHVTDMENGSLDYPNVDITGNGTLTGLALSTGESTGTFGDLSASPVDGTLYFVFSDNRDGVHDVPQPVTNADVFVMASSDGGATWTGPDPVSTATSDQAYPWAAVSPVTGELGVMFYDRSYQDPRDRMLDVTLATGLPGSFETTRVTTQSMPLTDNLWFPFDLPGCQQQCASFIGDYNSFVYDADGTADIVWTDTKRFVKVRGVGEGYNENTFFAREDEDAG